MSEYIEREAVMKIIDDYGTTHGSVLGSHSGAVDVVGDIIYNLPVADVAPVVHGYWTLERDPDGEPVCYHCSACDSDGHHTSMRIAYKYCPNCGAKMDGEELQNNE